MEESDAIPDTHSAKSVQLLIIVMIMIVIMILIMIININQRKYVGQYFSLFNVFKAKL